MSRASLDWHDAVAVTAWLGTFRVSLSDAHAVAQDMLRPPCERELGPVLHAKNYGDAWSQIAHAIEYATPPAPDGGAGPTP